MYERARTSAKSLAMYSVTAMINPSVQTSNSIPLLQFFSPDKDTNEDVEMCIEHQRSEFFFFLSFDNKQQVDSTGTCLFQQKWGFQVFIIWVCGE